MVSSVLVNGHIVSSRATGGVVRREIALGAEVFSVKVLLIALAVVIVQHENAKGKKVAGHSVVSTTQLTTKQASSYLGTSGAPTSRQARLHTCIVWGRIEIMKKTQEEISV